MFEADPRETDLLLLTIRQAIDPAEGISCRIGAVRARHSLELVNQCFSVKHKVEISYAFDGPCAFCDVVPESVCSVNAFAETFPSQQTYWRGKKRNIVRFFCWTPTERDPDFNLQIEVTSTAFSAGSTSDELADMGGSAAFVVYGSSREE